MRRCWRLMAACRWSKLARQRGGLSIHARSLAIAGSNLTATKALVDGMLDEIWLPATAADPVQPTAAETEASKAKLKHTRKYSTRTDPCRRGSREKINVRKTWTQAFQGHMHDYLRISSRRRRFGILSGQTFRTRIFYLLRRSVVTFCHLLKVRSTLKKSIFQNAKPQGKNIEARVRYWKSGSMNMSKPRPGLGAPSSMDMVTEDNRKERGDYETFSKSKRKNMMVCLKNAW